MRPLALFERLRTGVVQLIDVREPAELRAGTLPGAVNIPVDRLHLSKLTGDRCIVFVCMYGQRSSLAAAVARNAGFVDAWFLEGGIDAWTAAGLPLAASPAS